MKIGIYLTTFGSPAYVSGPKAKDAFDLDMGAKVPLSEVTNEFIRKPEAFDLPSYYNSR